MVSRLDGRQIVWPEPTHGDSDSLQVKAGRLKPWRSAGEKLPVQSIFDRRKPLSENTMRPIGRGMWKFIINNPQPYIAPVEWKAGNYTGPVAAFLAKYHTETNHDARSLTLDRPLLMQDTSNRFALVTANLVKYRGTNIRINVA